MARNIRTQNRGVVGEALRSNGSPISSKLVHQIRLDRHDGASLNSPASEHHVARTTAQNWLRNRCLLEQEGGLARIIH